MEPKLITGGLHTDERGSVSFVNGFDMSDVKRMYVIHHPDTSVIRAWQGHQKEQKWFFVTEGSFKIVLIKPNDWRYPSDDLPATAFALSSMESSVLHVPGGYLNGFQALEPNSKMILFSDATVEASQKDDFRFDKERWYRW